MPEGRSLKIYEALIPKPGKYQFEISGHEVNRFQDPDNSNYLRFPLPGFSKDIKIDREYFLDAFKIVGNKLTVSIKQPGDPILIRGERKYYLPFNANNQSN